MEKNTLKINITSTMSFTPELVSLDINDSQVLTNTKQAITKSNEVFKKLQEKIVEIGFKEDDLKTILFDTHEKTEYVDNKHMVVGIQYTHDMNIKFLRDDNKLNDIIDLIQKNFVKLSFRINYEFIDKSKHKDVVLSMAIKQAIHKANIICDSSNLVLGDILSIDTTQEYNNELMSYGRSKNNDMLAGSIDLSFNSMTPEDKKISETVTVVFETKNFN